MVQQRLYNFLNTYSGWFIIIGLTAFPVLRLLSIQMNAMSSFTTYTVFSILGRALGLAGVTLFSLNFLLSIRHRVLEKFFYGLNKVYAAHHILGGISLIFLLLHPLFLALRYVPNDWQQGAMLLIPSIKAPVNWPLNYGIIALYGMAILLILTFYVKLRYELWLWTHKLLGIIFYIGVLHSFLNPSDLSSDMVLRVYMIVVTFVGLSSYVYITLFGAFLIRKYPYIVHAIEKITDDVVSITLKPIRHVIPFKSGQFVFVRFFQKDISSQQHPFSVSSISKEHDKQLFTITAKNLGDNTNTLALLKTDTEAEIEGAFGKFSYTHATYSDQVWIAGGIGITPFLSMAQDLADKPYSVDLFYSVKIRNELVGMAALDEIARQDNISLRIHPYVGDEENSFITADYISKKIAGHVNKDIFICGPPGMMAALRKQFRKLGVKNYLIHSEEFSID